MAGDMDARRAARARGLRDEARGAKADYAVVATSRSIAPSGDAGILTVRGDIADPATAERVIAAARDRFGRVDTLVNNAGIFVAKPSPITPSTTTGLSG
jgi:NAD(P)-dependent dehydrogenase (short-subunit alcohol dehydrogenase family)